MRLRRAIPKLAPAAEVRLTLSYHPRAHLTTKRLVIGHVMVCHGCCCGNLSKGKPEVPVEWLKEEWRHRGLLKNIQLTICGCLGPCDLSNVIAISDAGERAWLGNVSQHVQYLALLNWA